MSKKPISNKAKKRVKKPEKAKRINTSTFSPKLKRVFLLILFVEALLLYANTARHGYVLDDMSVIESNWVTQRGIDGVGIHLKNSYRHGYWSNQGTLYRPLSLVMFALEWEISPNNSSIHHLINILIYGLLGVVLFIFLNNLFREQKPILAFLATALFIAHPIHTEVVANIKSRDELLAFFLIVLSLQMLLNYVRNKKVLSLLISIVLYFLAFMSKESAITFLAIIPLILIYYRDYSIPKSLITTAFYLPAAGVYLGLRASVLGSVSGLEVVDKIDNLLVGLSGGERFATAIKIVGMYLWKLIFPHPLANDYSFNQITESGLGSPTFLISLAACLFIAYIAIKGFKTKTVLSFAIFYFAITFSLYSNLIITIGTSFGERLLFIPSLGFCLVLAYFILQLVKPLKENSVEWQKVKSNAGGALVIVALLIGTYSWKTIDRNKAWKDNNTLYSTDVATSSNSARSHYYYGLSTMTDMAMKTDNPEERKRFLQEAVSSFKRSIEIYPRYSEAFGSLGLAYFRLGDEKLALEAYDQAIVISGGSAIILNNKAVIHFNNREYEKALETYKKIVQIDPRYVDGLRGLASVYGTLGNFEMAIKYFQEAIKYGPRNADLYYFLGLTYNNAGMPDKAKEAFATAKSLNPSMKIPDSNQ